MNTTMYDALVKSGINKQDARAAAIEAGRNDLRFITIDHSLHELRSHMDQSITELRVEIERSANRTIYAVMIIVSVGIAILSFLLPVILKFLQ